MSFVTCKREKTDRQLQLRKYVFKLNKNKLKIFKLFNVLAKQNKKIVNKLIYE